MIEASDQKTLVCVVLENVDKLCILFNLEELFNIGENQHLSDSANKKPVKHDQIHKDSVAQLLYWIALDLCLINC